MTATEAKEAAEELNKKRLVAEDGTHLLVPGALGADYRLRFDKNEAGGWYPLGKWVPCYHHAKGYLPAECEGASAEDRVNITRERLRDLV